MTGRTDRPHLIVMAGLDPAIHAFPERMRRKCVDARIKSGHDG
jgi:hypothetical protein